MFTRGQKQVLHACGGQCVKTLSIFNPGRPLFDVLSHLTTRASIKPPVRQLLEGRFYVVPANQHAFTSTKPWEALSLHYYIFENMTVCYGIEIKNRPMDGISNLSVWFGEHFCYIGLCRHHG